MDADPFHRSDLVFPVLPVEALGKNLGTAAGQGINTGFESALPGPAASLLPEVSAK
jgi:hypothetical protein